jgi:uncharacterized protein YodC (DUF2158 family)
MRREGASEGKVRVRYYDGKTKPVDGWHRARLKSENEREDELRRDESSASN